MSLTVEQLIRVVLNDQAYLYALIQEMKASLAGEDVTPEMFEAFQSEWAELTKGILEELEDATADSES